MKEELCRLEAQALRAIESAVAAGAIGAVRMIHGRKSYKLGERGPLYRRRDRYGGMLPWVGVHAIDLILALGGPCDGVMAAQSDRGNRGHGELEMSAATILRLSGGAIGTVTADYLRPGGAPRHDARQPQPPGEQPSVPPDAHRGRRRGGPSRGR